MEMKKKSGKMVANAFKGMSLPDNARLLAIAEREASAYMGNIAGED